MELIGAISSLHRYPVKSMVGERLDTAVVSNAGVPGDREWAVRSGEASHGQRFQIPDGFHNPEANDLPLAQAAFRALFDLAGVEREPL